MSFSDLEKYCLLPKHERGRHVTEQRSITGTALSLREAKSQCGSEKVYACVPHGRILGGWLRYEGKRAPYSLLPSPAIDL